ncbi:Trp biosynthesis-associated membrane protein [Paenarthrobacter sp. NPDC089322]|uniref:Trp biosynthesis-associated membrane protein n=1 Tax=Paenarthrobacter sp. NPDC089322 TaxID=3155065 RepID=UPI003431052D
MTAGGAVPAARQTPRWARKSTLVLATIVLALAVFGTSTQTWVEVRLDPSVGAINELSVQGSKAANSVTALAVVALAAGLAASIGGKVARWIIAAIVALTAVGIVLAAATVLADPLGAAQGSIAAATGISGGQADVDTTFLPVIAIVAGALLAVCAVLLPFAGRYWKSRTRYDTAARAKERGEGPVDEIDSWDSLSRGEDPT